MDQSDGDLSGLASAVFSAPWKTPSQYAAYIGSVQRALDVTQHRQRHNDEMVSRMTAKSATDVHLASRHEAKSKLELQSRDSHRRHIAKIVGKNSSRSSLNAAATHRAPATKLSDAQRTGTVTLQSAVTPQLRPVGASVTESSAKAGGGAAPSPSKVPLPPPTAPRYMYEDEIGVIDIDEGESDRDDGSNDEAPVASEDPPLSPHDARECRRDDVDHLGDDEDNRLMLVDESRLLAFMLQLDDETDAMVRDIAEQCTSANTNVFNHAVEREDLDWEGAVRPTTFPAMVRPSSQATTRREVSAAMLRRAGGSAKSRNPYHMDQTKSIAVYMSSLRPHGTRAVLNIESSRRQKLEQTWKEIWDSIFGDYTRSTAARRMKDNSTNRNAHVVMEQEAAARISMISRYHASTERLKRDEVLMAQKITRMAKFRGRLNAKEEFMFRDDALQKETLDQLAHKMLERVMKSHEQSDASDVLVDNTDPWEGGRRRQSSSAGGDGKIRRLSAALKAGGLLNQFYDGQRRRTTMLRRASVAPSGGDPSQPSLTSEGSGVQGLMPSVSFATPPPSRERQDRRGSMWAPSSVKERSRSIAYSIPSNETPPDGAVPAVVTEAEVDADTRAKNAARLKATEARWEQDAKKLAAAIEKELLQKCKPDFGKSYDERITKVDEQSASVANMNLSATPGAFEGFTFGEPSESSSPHSAGMPREAPQRSAVISVDNLNFGKEDAVRTPDNPVALALKQRKEDAQTRHDERLQRYRHATNRHNLTNAVDAIIQGKVGRVADFQEMAGMHRSHYQEGGNKLGVASRAVGTPQSKYFGDKSTEYLVDRQPSHTNFDVTNRISDMLLASGPSPYGDDAPAPAPWHTMSAFKLDHPASHSDQHRLNQDGSSQLKFLRKASIARMRTMDNNSELVDNSRASFAQFTLHDGDEVDPSMELPGLTRRRSSAFFQPASTQRQREVDFVGQQGTSANVPDEIVLSNEAHWIGGQSRKSAESSTTTDRSITDMNTTLRRRRSNVAALLLTSGLGRHDVAETRKSGNGDTILYAKQRARNSGASKLAPTGTKRDESGTELPETFEEPQQRLVSWGDSHRSSDEGAGVRRAKSKVHFSSHGDVVEAVGVPIGPEASTTTSTASSGSPAYELINPTLPPTGPPSATSVPMFLWDVEVTQNNNHVERVESDDGDDSDGVRKNENEGRLSVSLRRATSVLSQGKTSAISNRHAQSTPQSSLVKKKQRSPRRTPDTWCLDVSDFQR